MAEERIYQKSYASDTQGLVAALDALGLSTAAKALWPYHFVDTLPASPVQGQRYFLNAATGNFPVGAYEHNGDGWLCVVQHGQVYLDDWTGAVSEELVSGAKYLAFVSGEVTSLEVTMTTRGACRIIVSKDSALAVAEPSYTDSNTVLMTLTDSGTDALLDTSVFSVLATINFTDFSSFGGRKEYEWGTTQRSEVSVAAS